MDVIEALLNTAIKMHHQGILPGVNDLTRSLIGVLGEAKVIELTKGTIHNASHDVVGTENFVGRIEVKSAFKSTQGLLGAWGLMCKRGKCDYFAIVDMSKFYDDKYRVSIIPHDEMFKHLDIPNKKGKTPDYFKWSETYNETDKKSVTSTDLFLKYEVKGL